VDPICLLFTFADSLKHVFEFEDYVRNYIVMFPKTSAFLLFDNVSIIC
jgi:hypothetical protein